MPPVEEMLTLPFPRFTRIVTHSTSKTPHWAVNRDKFGNAWTGRILSARGSAPARSNRLAITDRPPALGLSLSGGKGFPSKGRIMSIKNSKFNRRGVSSIIVVNLFVVMMIFAFMTLNISNNQRHFTAAPNLVGLGVPLGC